MKTKTLFIAFLMLSFCSSTKTIYRNLDDDLSIVMEEYKIIRIDTLNSYGGNILEVLVKEK